MRKKDDFFDFRALGQAIKAARLKRGMTRDEAAAVVHIDPRYLTNIENKGQNPRLQNFYKLVTMFDISVDQFFYPNAEPAKSTRRRQVDNALNLLTDKDLLIVEATAKGIVQAKGAEEN